MRTGRRWLLVTVGVVLAAVTFAYIDGGETALRPIAEPVAVPAEGAA